MLFWRAFLATLVAVLLSATVALPAANAHAEVVEARPGRSATVGGAIDVVELQFVGLLDGGDHRVSLTGPDAQTVPPTGDLLLLGQLLRLPVTPLTMPGEYLINYRVDSVDDDVSVGTIRFTYDPAADPPPPFRARQETRITDGGRPTVLLVGLSALAVVFVAWIGRRLWVTR